MYGFSRTYLYKLLYCMYNVTTIFFLFNLSKNKKVISNIKKRQKTKKKKCPRKYQKPKTKKS